MQPRTDSTRQPAGHDDERGRDHARIAANHMTPLWVVLHALVSAQPQSAELPAIRRYAELRAQVLEAGGIISVC
jgi:gentisate 1,2-dioxygenase